jgi:murein L,D-transpeptidase YafK
MLLKAFFLATALILGALPGAGFAAPPEHGKKIIAKPKAAAKHAPAPAKIAPAKATPVKPAPRAGQAEARLLEIYRLIGQSETQTALTKAGQLVQDFPTFALAQLVYGDLLSARTRPIKAFGDVPADQLGSNAEALAELRVESQLRLKALKERPAAGTVPEEFLLLSPRNKHAIAVDASRSRLYLFENRPTGLALVADYYISVGKLGVEKKTAGDQRTPLGVYFITSQLDPKMLKDFYGAGALPINYPNVLDLRRGKTGSGIWLHGTPPGQFSRPPQASDGCVVVANPDLESIISTVSIRTTPVVIAQQIKWVPPQSAQAKTHQFETRLNAWLKAKSTGNIVELNSFYAPDFNNSGKTLADWLPSLQKEVAVAKGRPLAIKDLSLLHWQDTEDTIVATFGEVAAGQLTGSTKRQYWGRRGGQWTIFYEGLM